MNRIDFPNFIYVLLIRRNVVGFSIDSFPITLLDSPLPSTVLCASLSESNLTSTFLVWIALLSVCTEVLARSSAQRCATAGVSHLVQVTEGQYVTSTVKYVSCRCTADTLQTKVFKQRILE